MKVSHDEQQSQFTAATDSGTARLSYTRLENGDLDIRHTSVPPSDEGRGIGGELVKAAVEHASSAGVKVVPSCPFARAWVADNPELSESVRS